MKRLAWRSLLGVLLLAAAAGCGLGLRLAYPALTEGLWNQVRYASLAESRNLWRWVEYLLAFLQKLTWNPRTGLYDFDRTPEAGLSRFDRALLAFHRGRFARAAALLERHIEEDGESEDALFWLALSSLRQAEADNCLHHLRSGSASPQRLCSLPLIEPHRRKQLARRAADLFARLLERHDPDPADRRLYLWLLNFSAMATGDFPGAVPTRHLLRTPFVEAFYGTAAARTRRAHADLRFADRARELGIDNFGAGRGVAVEDFDGDGDLDLAAAGLFGGVRFYRNDWREARRFADATAGSGLEGARQPLTLSTADFDGDGRLDLFVIRPFDHYLLFRNLGSGRFRDVTAGSGLLDALPPGGIATSWISIWGDVDSDGDLDLFLSNWAFRVPLVRGLPARPRQSSKLFLNERGRFRDATRELGLARRLADRHYIGAAFGDYDADGRLDLYVVGPLPGTGLLLHNEGGRFEPDPRLASAAPGFTAAFADVDHDGRLDLFRAGFGDARSAVAQAVFGEPGFKSGHSTMFLQMPGGRFEQRDDLFGGGMPMGTMGASFGDLDNDGCLDFYLGTGSPEPWFILPNLMYRGERRGSRCTGRLANVSALAGFGNVQKGHGIVFFDFDGDGDQDVYSALGGMWPSDQWPSQLFVNQGDGGNAWVKVRLRGRRSNRFGLGSTLVVRAEAADGTPVVRTYHMDAKTGFGSAPYLAHVGLGKAVRLDGVRVTWLGSGCSHTYPARLNAESLLDEADCLRARPAGRSGDRDISQTSVSTQAGAQQGGRNRSHG